MSGRKPNKFILDDGQSVDYHQVMEVVGIGKGAANGRLRATTNPEVVFAPKGRAYGLLYSSRDRKKYNKKPTDAEAQKLERSMLGDFIMRTKPFYNDPMLTLALKKISCK